MGVEKEKKGRGGGKSSAFAGRGDDKYVRDDVH